MSSASEVVELVLDRCDVQRLKPVEHPAHLGRRLVDVPAQGEGSVPLLWGKAELDEGGLDGVPELDVLADDRLVVGERLRLVDLQVLGLEAAAPGLETVDPVVGRLRRGLGLRLVRVRRDERDAGVVASARRLAHGVDAEGGADQAEEGERQENVQAKLRRHAVSIGTSGSKA